MLLAMRSLGLRKGPIVRRRRLPCVAINSDHFFEAIFRRLGPLNPETFELCVAEFLAQDWLRLVAVVGGTGRFRAALPSVRPPKPWVANSRCNGEMLRNSVPLHPPVGAS